MTSAASTGRTLFTLAGFRNEMRQVGGNTSGRLFAEQELIPETLDEHPNPALAWVVGLYALVLRRRPEPRRMQDLLTDLRRGAAPADVLEGILRSPDGIGRTVTRPVLEEAYVTGAYLTCLARFPDPAGLATYAEALRQGMSEGHLLEILLSSEEAQGKRRFPPARVDEVTVLAEKIQTVALRTHVTPEQTQWATEALRRGVHSRQVVRSVLAGQATGTYLGKVAVARGSDGTDAGQSVRAMLENLGIATEGGQARSKNVAAVIVTANLPAFVQSGARIDVTVSSLGFSATRSGTPITSYCRSSAGSSRWALASVNCCHAGWSVRSCVVWSKRSWKSIRSRPLAAS